MGNLGIYFSEESIKLKNKFFPKKGGNYGSFSALVEELFLNWIKEKDTIEYWEAKKEEALDKIEEANQLKLKCELNQKLINERSLEMMKKNFEYFSRNEEIINYLKNVLKLINGKEFDINQSLKAFINLTKKEISLNYYKKILEYAKSNLK